MRSPVRLLRRLRTALTPATRVREHWSEEAGSWHVGRGVQWTEVPAVIARINRRVSGDPTKDPYLYVLENFLQGRVPLERCITLGCGAGEFERGVAQYGVVLRHDAVDIAEGAIAKARAAAADAELKHVDYRIADLNALSLEKEVYDAAFGIFSIHHVERLEHLFAEVRRALKPGGLFVLNEFVGPTRFQWTDRQLAVINGLLGGLPASLRRCVNDPSREKTKVDRPTIEEMKGFDPSEAVRSQEILPLLPDYFEVVEVHPYGGTVLQTLLLDIAGNFDTDEPATRNILEAIMDLEEALIEIGDLESDFAFIIARKPTSGLNG